LGGNLGDAGTTTLDAVERLRPSGTTIDAEHRTGLAADDA